MKYLRYEFKDEEQFESKLSSLPHEDVDGESVLSESASIIKLGHLVLKDAVYGDGDEIVEEAVISDKYAVDVMWNDLDESPYGWKSYEVYPKNPKHKLYL
ncbi:MAG: hypothetical protein HRU18_11060 [Pseudoalteromonas sp.]|uniref:hypothetical protein n=1 Tax=Pseudoalteromonas sp. TaxID=53249 RepID=UPI001DA562E4|nr:hypothetical protein [Pseudoalteromonas sp.]NRA78738.1 hypothetical protein [Pseudoalteromonas sp.]